MTTISIAMASYNGARHIGEQLDSFARQTRLPDELVITDDASSDDTAAVVDAFARTARFPVRFIRNEAGLGFSANFEAAVRQTRGDLVFMSDQDDAWYPRKLEVMEAAFADRRVFSAICDQEIADEEGRGTGRTVLENVRRLGYRDDHHGTGACTALRRALLPVLLPFPVGIPYDLWTNRIPHVLGIRRLVAEPLQMYRRHGSNVTHSLLARSDASALSLVADGPPDRGEAYARLVHGIELQTARLRERRGELAAAGLAEAAERALLTLEGERRDHQLRLDALRRPRAARAPAVARMLIGGNYRRFQGWKSAAKDLVAP